jgi:hypothetical protein
VHKVQYKVHKEMLVIQELKVLRELRERLKELKG